MQDLEKKVSRREFLIKFGKTLGGIELAMACSGCGIAGLRGRIGSIPTLSPITSFLNLENLKLHGSGGEGKGQIYTCKAGHIDLAHTRNSMDRTMYFASKINLHLMENKESELSLKASEPGPYIVKFNYPENWKSLPQDEREQIAYDISVRLGAYVSYASVTWHEIITWLGHRPQIIISDFPSAFTWEDNFSNLLGSYLGVQVLQDIRTFDQKTFDKALTLALDKEVKELGIQSKKVARRAAKEVSGSWWSGLFGANVKKRHFDIGLDDDGIGLDDGYVTPFLIPGIPECEGAEAKAYPVHNLDFSEYGFSVKFEIEPRAKKNKIMKIVYPGEKGKKRIEPAIHFAPIMDYIKRDAVERYGPNVDVP